MAVITNIRKLNNAGVLANRIASAGSLEFLRYNLIYGYNGSGKSTLSRLFACLRAAAVDENVPDQCTFEFQLSDGSLISCPDKLNGIEKHVLVFNTDFVERNLQWSEAHANPVFYIGQEQAEAAAALSKKNSDLNAAQVEQAAAAMEVNSTAKYLATLKRNFAKEVAGKLHLHGRKYEANHWTDDFSKLGADESAVLTKDELDVAEATCRLEEPMPKVALIASTLPDLGNAVKKCRALAQETISTVAISEFEKHPSMVEWIKDGNDYHNKNSLSTCLFCGNTISQERRTLLQQALDDSLSKHISDLAHIEQDITAQLEIFRAFSTAFPPVEALGAELHNCYRDELAKLGVQKKNAEEALLKCQVAISRKRERPTLAIDVSELPTTQYAENISANFLLGIAAINATLTKHNEQHDEFATRQEHARVDIRKHYLATNAVEYRQAVKEADDATQNKSTAETKINGLNADIADLERQVRQHGPAAEKINQLIKSYLGHSELSIQPIDNGYQIQRYGKPIEGHPSEGEKTAIAVSYFLSMLDADGRKLRELIVVLDDPISSLDTKALNFAASALRSRLDGAAQLFVLTHNHNFMNEFKKFWKNRQNPRDGKEATAAFYFLDVTTTKTDHRSSSIIEMPRLLREYDSEYHFLFHYVLDSEEKGTDYEYAYMLPNVLRRILDVFLAFRCPGNSGLASKMEQLCATYKALDKDRLTALERLSQVESHSDNIDDLIAFSSMTLEETSAATKALLAMMEVVDPEHLRGLRRLCR